MLLLPSYVLLAGLARQLDAALACRLCAHPHSSGRTRCGFGSLVPSARERLEKLPRSLPIFDLGLGTCSGARRQGTLWGQPFCLQLAVRGSMWPVGSCPPPSRGQQSGARFNANSRKALQISPDKYAIYATLQDA